MTEYTSSPEAIREYMSSRDRTVLWVQRTHSPTRDEFYSPSAPPTDLPPTPTSPPSEIESTYSIPPKMVLKYADGRPDIPISHWHYDGSHHHHSSSRSSTKRHDGDSGPYQQQSPYTHTRSRSHSAGGGLAPDRDRLGRSGSHRVEHTNKPHEMRRPLTPQSPEEIRVWPSDSDDIPRQPRSKSLPRNSHFRTESPPPPMPSTTHTVPLQAMFTSPTPRHTHHIPPHNGLIPRSTTPRLAHPQPRPSGWHSIPQPPPSKGSSRAPPAIIYAPSNHSKGHYVPPHIVPSHAHRNAGGMKFSHSDPVRYHDHRYGDHYGEPFFRDARPGTADESARSRSRVTSSQESEPDSDDSGSTYYVMPTPGQKVHIIAPEGSIYTATSTTKSPSSPHFKKPFFHRLLEKLSVTDSSKASSTTSSSRRLQRRHSTGGRNRSNEQRAQ